MDYFREEETCIVFSTSIHYVANLFILNEISKKWKNNQTTRVVLERLDLLFCKTCILYYIFDWNA